uniref:Uncharacterized protein n=1 Tax=viral metagenome TaxID=1070528 RepID=A0A6C0CBA0_9ZZZZ
MYILMRTRINDLYENKYDKPILCNENGQLTKKSLKLPALFSTKSAGFRHQKSGHIFLIFYIFQAFKKSLKKIQF